MSTLEAVKHLRAGNLGKLKDSINKVLHAKAVAKVAELRKQVLNKILNKK